jgi:hypothetical protein
VLAPGERVEKEIKEAVIYKADATTSKFDTDHTIAISESDFLVLMMKRKVYFFI